MNELDHLTNCLMIDNLDIAVPNVDVSRLPRKYVQLDGTENQKWAKGRLKNLYGASSLRVRGIKGRRELIVEGSPAGHFQGHNIVSSGDAVMLAYSGLKAVKDEFNLAFDIERAPGFASGDGMRVSRIDTPVLLAVPEGLKKSAIVNGLALAGVYAGIHVSVYSGESVYFAPESQSASLKAYDKEVQQKKKRRGKLPDSEGHAELMELASRTLRLEPVFRRKYLERRFNGVLPSPRQLSPEELASAFEDLLSKFDLRRDIRAPLNDEQLIEIPSQFRHIVFYWQRGRDVLKMLDGNENAYKKARAYLRKNHSIDIEAPPPREEIEQRIEVGELLRPQNFLPVPERIRKNPSIFYEIDMEREHTAQNKRKGQRLAWQAWQEIAERRRPHAHASA
jgi:hypothetical protein